MDYLKNPYHFYLKRIQGIKEPQNKWMWRGSEIHKVYEDYYENVRFVWETWELTYDDVTKYLPTDTTKWAAWTEPFVVNFLAWETRRLKAARAAGDESLFVPIVIEAELWDWRDEDDVPLMGFADVVLHSASIPEVEQETGVTVVDFKTGKSKNGFTYGDKPGGVLDELEYYTMLFEGEYEVTATAIYYPKDDKVLPAVPDETRRAELLGAIEEICTLGDDPDLYPINPGPLCMYGKEPEKRSALYGLCPECRWGQADGPGPTYVD